MYMSGMIPRNSTKKQEHKCHALLHKTVSINNKKYQTRAGASGENSFLRVEITDNLNNGNL